MFVKIAVVKKNKIQCCSVDVGVGLLLELLKLLMSQEQDSMLFCLMLVKDCGKSEIENCMSMINVKRTRFNVVLLMGWSWFVVGIVEIADVARTRFNVVLFDVCKRLWPI